MNVAFLVNDLQLSGGVGVVVQHARQVRSHGHDATLVLVREQDQPHWGYDSLAGLRVASLSEVRSERFDVAVATWWETTYSLFTVSADRHAYFVQSLEDRFYAPDMAERLGAAVTLGLPVSFITEARWIRETLAELRPEAPCFYVRNGIDKATFQPLERVDAALDGPLRILIEGNPSVAHKAVRDAVDAVEAMDEPRHVTVVTSEHAALADAPVDRVVGPVPHAEMAGLYGETDVVLKLSRVEGMFGPPLEGFHRGATCVVTEVTGHDEYVVHGWNGLVADWDDPHGTARLLDRLARDRRELHFLRANALATAQSWPSWEQAGQFMTLALERIVREPPAPAGTAALMADIRTGVQDLQRPLHELQALQRAMAKVQAVIGLRGLSRLIAARHRPPLRQIASAVGRLGHWLRLARKFSDGARARREAIAQRIRRR